MAINRVNIWDYQIAQVQDSEPLVGCTDTKLTEMTALLNWRVNEYIAGYGED